TQEYPVSRTVRVVQHGNFAECRTLHPHQDRPLRGGNVVGGRERQVPVPRQIPRITVLTSGGRDRADLGWCHGAAAVAGASGPEQQRRCGHATPPSLKRLSIRCRCSIAVSRASCRIPLCPDRKSTRLNSSHVKISY